MTDQPIAEWNPDPTPHWVKETLVEDDLDWLRRTGQTVDATEVERRVVAELEQSDAVEERRPGLPKLRPDVSKIKAAVEERQRASGWSELAKDRDIRKDRLRLTGQCGCGGWCETCRVYRRVQQLLVKEQPPPGSRRVTFRYPAFVERIKRLWVQSLQLRTSPDASHAAEVVTLGLRRIATDSVPLLGAW